MLHLTCTIFQLLYTIGLKQTSLFSAFLYDNSVEINTVNGEACFSISIMDDTVYTETLRYIVMSFSLTNSNDEFVGSSEVNITIEDGG